ncbi:MAG: hypothetical protein ABFR05_13100, partial [Bacteroidota bacterium]
MKYLKKIYKLLLIIILVFSFNQCKTKDMVQKNLPFTINEKTIQKWVGGKEGSNGLIISIKGSTISDNIYFKIMYYKSFEENIVADFQGGNFTLNSNFAFVKKDMKMTNEPLGEYGNEAPQLGNSNPFNLKENEVVILYTIAGKEYYHKI